MKYSFLVCLILIVSGQVWAQKKKPAPTPTPVPTVIPTVQPTPVVIDKTETFEIETEIDKDDQNAIDDHEAEIRRFFELELRSLFTANLLKTEPYYCPVSKKIKYRAIVQWGRSRSNQAFDESAFKKNFNRSLKQWQTNDPELMYIKLTQPTLGLPGVKFARNGFSLNASGDPINRQSVESGFNHLNHSYAGKVNAINNSLWWEGSARLQVYMDLTRYLNTRTKSTIMLTAGYYTSFVDLRQEENGMDYLNVLNNGGIRFHRPEYGQFNVGLKIILDGKKKPKAPRY